MYRFRNKQASNDSSVVPQATYADPQLPIGTWLRRTSLDELPQFFTVLLGDMRSCGLGLAFFCTTTTNSCYADHSMPGINVFRFFPKTLCYAQEGTAGSSNLPTGGAGGSGGCPLGTDSTLLERLEQANPQGDPAYSLDWIIDGPVESADPNQCCYDVCMLENRV